MDDLEKAAVIRNGILGNCDTLSRMLPKFFIHLHSSFESRRLFRSPQQGATDMLRDLSRVEAAIFIGVVLILARAGVWAMMG
jgi:hypothetical protein